MLLESVKEDNFGAAKVIAEEIEKVTKMAFTSSNVAACGTWIWVGGSMLVTICPGGAIISADQKASWKWTDEAQRKLQIKWQSGWVDDLTLSEDGQTMKARNNAGGEFTARRLSPTVAEEKPEANRAAPAAEKAE